METESKNSKEQGLKHLGFMRAAAIQILVSVSNLYNYAKQNSGSLKSAVEKVEGAVTTVVSPVINQFKDVPDSLLVFLDQKFDKQAPPMAKQVVTHVHVFIYKATEKTQCFVKEVRTGGPKAGFKYAAVEYKYVVVTSSVKVWVKLNQYKPIHAVGEKALPVAAKLSGRYNELVTDMSQMGYSVVGYLPLVPVDDIAKAYEKEYAALKKGDTTTTDGSKSSSDSDTD